VSAGSDETEGQAHVRAMRHELSRAEDQVKALTKRVDALTVENENLRLRLAQTWTCSDETGCGWVGPAEQTKTVATVIAMAGSREHQRELAYALLAKMPIESRTCPLCKSRCEVLTGRKSSLTPPGKFL